MSEKLIARAWCLWNGIYKAFCFDSERAISSYEFHQACRDLEKTRIQYCKLINEIMASGKEKALGQELEKPKIHN